MPIRAFKKNRQLIILCLLTTLLVFGGHLPILLESITFYITVFGIALISFSKSKFFNILLACSTVFYLLAWMRSFHDVQFNILYAVFALLCLSYSIHSTIRFVITSKQVTQNEIFALINCYLTVGFFWAMLYTLVEGFFPGSFSMQTTRERTVDTLIYYSFTTMTTVGYGDMVPRTILAQRLSVTQAIFGQFYFALVVAYLLNKLFQRRVETDD